MVSRSMTTEVSSRPRSGRSLLGTRGDGLVGDVVEVAAESVVVDRWCGPEQFDRGFGSYESVATERGEFADWLTVAGDDERLALDEGAHDAAAVVSKLSLADLGAHEPLA